MQICTSSVVCQSGMVMGTRSGMRVQAVPRQSGFYICCSISFLAYCEIIWYSHKMFLYVTWVVEQRAAFVNGIAGSLRVLPHHPLGWWWERRPKRQTTSSSRREGGSVLVVLLSSCHYSTYLFITMQEEWDEEWVCFWGPRGKTLLVIFLECMFVSNYAKLRPRSSSINWQLDLQ